MSYTQINVSPDGKSFGFEIGSDSSEDTPPRVKDAVKEITRRRAALGFDNSAPRRRAGQRRSPVETNPNTTLTWADVRAMRAAGQAQSTAMLATLYDLSEMEVRKILKNKAWTDPSYTPPARKRRVENP